jgi:threonine/homoserine/homoserine lactone efflux protein
MEITTYLTLFFTSMVVALSGALMPGPLLTVTISESAQRGMKAGPLLITGHAILELALLTALLFGMAPLFNKTWFFILISFAGGGIMFWMAWGMFRSLPTLTVQNKGNEKRKNNLIMAGALMSLANPYWIIWWATIGITYIALSQKSGILGVAVFFMGHIIGDALWYIAVSVAISKGKKIFTDPVYRTIIAICGAFLIAFAGWLVWSGIERLN